MRKALVFGLSAVLIAAVLLVMGCGGGAAATNPTTKAGSNTSSITTGNSTGANSTSDSSTGSAAGKASAIKFVTQPGGARAGQPFTVQPSVAIVDGNGEIVTNYIGNVSLRIESGDGDISGSSSVIFVKGVATFTDVGINKPGTYTLKAITREIQATVSDSFTVAP